MNTSSKRAELTSVVTLVISLLFFVITWLLGSSSNSFAVSAFKWQILAGVIISIVLWFHFHLKGLSEQENLDMAQLSSNEQEDSIFQEQGTRKDLFQVAGKRLELFEKFFVPVFSVIIAVYQVAIGIFLVYQARIMADSAAKFPQAYALYMFVISVVIFLISRYATILSGQGKWRGLRAVASWMTGCSVVGLLIAVGLGLSQIKIYSMHTIMGWVVPVLLIVIGAESGLNIVFDFFRPRISGQYHRAAFDSRLLGLINEPGGIFKSIAHTIDYQFGFQVSQTWFYKLFEKAVAPLILLSILLIWASSCVLIIEPGEQAIVEKFGIPQNNGEPLGAGLSWKLPWPVEKAYKKKIEEIQILHIGYVPKENQGRIPLLWGTEHYASEDNLLIGAKTSAQLAEQTTASFSMVVAAVNVHYKINDLYGYLYNNANPDDIFAGVAYRELTRFAASSTVESDDNSESIIGAGRGAAAKVIKENIQQGADEKGLGIEVVFVGLEGVHPPKEVAPDYQAVVGAVQQRQAAVLNAMAYRNMTLASLCGSVESAYELSGLADEYINAESGRKAGELDELGKRLDDAIFDASGDIYKRLARAQTYAFSKEIASRADSERFTSQLQAYYASPEIYKQQLRLTMLEEALGGIRKYVVLADVNDSQILIFDLKEKMIQSLYDIEVED